MKKIVFLTVAFLSMASVTNAQIAEPKTEGAPKNEEKKEVTASEKKWYDYISIKGYVQARYNRILESNHNLKIDQGDRSVGDKQGFLIRRARVVFSGQLTKTISFYIQPDFAAAIDDSKQNFVQLRDAYFDLGLDSKNEFRVRVGQSKVPYGFDNLQSSQNRLSMDRSDAINSGPVNERDLGVFAFWTPENKKKLYAELAKQGLKTTGDYGIFAVGAYNGQTANIKEMNNNLHVVARATYPFEIGSQVIEGSLQAYKGKFVLPTVVDAGVSSEPNNDFDDERVAASFILYPKPFGIQAEYNIGRGPEFNVLSNEIKESHLEGGYITASYFTKIKENKLIPFARYQYYQGGYKTQKHSRSHKINEFEVGLEWQPSKYFELTATYNFNDRNYIESITKSNFQKGNMLRLQAQINF